MSDAYDSPSLPAMEGEFLFTHKSYGAVEYFSKIARKCCRKLCYQQLTGMVKKVTQQGHSRFGARSVLPVREYDKMARTPLATFFNSP